MDRLAVAVLAFSIARLLADSTLWPRVIPCHIVFRQDSEMTEISRTIILRPYPTDYVYLHFHPQRPDEIVYVGRGSGGRAWSSDGRSTAHQLWMMEWQGLGYSPDQFVRIAARGLTPQ